MTDRKPLTVEILCTEAGTFADAESEHNDPAIYGVTDGKTIGTWLEHRFAAHLRERYSFSEGNTASGVDIPVLDVDIKATSISQPQSSAPFKSARQKIYGLGYHLLIFAYEKSDDEVSQTGRLDIAHTIFVDKSRTSDFQMTRGLCQIIENEGNEDDIIAFLQDRNLPVDDTEAREIAVAVLREPPLQGCLTISNALQWRLQYSRVITQAGAMDGVLRVR